MNGHYQHDKKINVHDDLEKEELWHTLDGNVNSYHIMEKKDGKKKTTK